MKLAILLSISVLMFSCDDPLERPEVVNKLRPLGVTYGDGSNAPIVPGTNLQINFHFLAPVSATAIQTETYAPARYPGATVVALDPPTLQGEPQVFGEFQSLTYASNYQVPDTLPNTGELPSRFRFGAPWTHRSSTPIPAKIRLLISQEPGCQVARRLNQCPSFRSQSWEDLCMWY